MRVLIACEFSGVVRRAFANHGHFAVSCDLLPGEGLQGEPGDHASIRQWGIHYQGSVFDLVQGDSMLFMENGGFDLMIAHPPCTFLCNSGVRWLYLDGKKYNGIDKNRWREMEDAAQFFLDVQSLPIKKKCLENPVMHGHAKAIIKMEATQTIQPHGYGHGEIKATQLYLDGLPNLVETDKVEGRDPRVHHASPGPDRWKERSRTLPGIAQAMAEQWGTA